MTKFIFALLSALIILSLPKQETPINNSTVKAKAKTVQVVAPEKVTATKQTPTEQQAVVTSEQTQPTQIAAVAQPPTSTPKQQALATLKDLGHEDSWYAVEFIAFKESSWKPQAVNSIGACGLFQALPCSKLPCNLDNVDCQVRWAHSYATHRYGSWHQAYAFWKANNWW